MGAKKETNRNIIPTEGGWRPSTFYVVASLMTVIIDIQKLSGRGGIRWRCLPDCT